LSESRFPAQKLKAACFAGFRSASRGDHPTFRSEKFPEQQKKGNRAQDNQNKQKTKLG
jgi:hypothetical protein